MRRIVGLLVMLFWALLAFPQAGLDSLIRVAESAKGDSVAVAYNAVGKLLCYSDPFKSIPYLLKALEAGQECGDAKQQCVSYSFLGTSSRYLGDYAKALQYFQGQLDVAFDNDVSDEKAWACINVGNIMTYMKNYAMAKDYLAHALELASDFNDESLLQYVYVNLGRVNILSKNFDEALEWHRKALGIRLKNLNEPINIAVTYRDMGSAHFENSRYDSSKYYYGLCMNILDTLPYNAVQASVFTNLAHIYIEENRVDSARYFAKQAMKCANHFHNKSIMSDACSMMGHVNFKMGNYREAERYYRLHIVYSDSLRSSEVQRQIYNVQLRNKQVSQEKEIEQMRKNRSNLVVIVAVLLAVFLSGVVFVVVLSFKRKNIRKMNSILDYQNSQLDSSIAYAQRIQQAVIPNMDKVGGIFNDRFMLFMPCSKVSGDFYWQHNSPQYEMFAVSDSGSHGIPGGFMSMLGTSILHEIAEQEHDPAAIIGEFRERVLAIVHKSSYNHVLDPTDMDLSLMVIDKKRRCILFSGIKTPLIYVRNGKVCILQDNSMLDSAASKVFKTDELPLESGDRIYMMTHGFCDQKGGEEGLAFSREKLFELLSDIWRRPMKQQKFMLQITLHNWCSHVGRMEDVTIAGFAYSDNY